MEAASETLRLRKLVQTELSKSGMPAWPELDDFTLRACDLVAGQMVAVKPSVDFNRVAATLSTISKVVSKNPECLHSEATIEARRAAQGSA